MLIKGPFILNGKEHTRESLLQHASEKGNDSGSPGWESETLQFITHFFNEEQPLVQQTSGTTGEPKSIFLSREAMLVSARRTLDHFGLKPGDSALLCLPVQYIAGKMMVVRAFLGGMNLVTVEPAGNLAETLEGLQGRMGKKDMEGKKIIEGKKDKESKVDFAAMVPLQVYELLKTPEAFNHIRKLIIGGGEISPAMRDRLRTIEETEIYETFAMSETYTHFATRRLNLPGKESEDSFRVMEGVQTQLDERGCLVVEIPGVTDRPVTSNDLAEINGPGSFRWLGRLDNVIKTGGIKVIPETIEAVVKELTGQESVILPVPDPRLGQRLVLVLEGEEIQLMDTPAMENNTGNKEDNSQGSALMKTLKKYLPKHELPKEVRYLKEFPRNRSMKVDRNEIRRVLGID